jgi:hypothetical protein
VGWSLWAAAMLVWAVQFVLWGLGGFHGSAGSTLRADWQEFLLRIGYAVTLGTASTIGALIIARQPQNVTGWLSAIAGLMVALIITSSVYAASPALSPPGSLPPGAVAVAWLGNLLGVNPVLIVPLLLLFPDGRLPSRRWRPVLWLAGACGLVAGLALAFRPGPLGTASAIDNPLGVAEAGDVLTVASDLASVGLIVAVLLSAAAMVVRFRRARGDERQQLKWVAFAAVPWVLGLAATFFAPRAWQPIVQLVYVALLTGFVA